MLAGKLLWEGVLGATTATAAIFGLWRSPHNCFGECESQIEPMKLDKTTKLMWLRSVQNRSFLQADIPNLIRNLARVSE